MKKQATRFLIALMFLFALNVLLADTITYKYDDAGRLVSVAYPNGSTIAYVYDNNGNLLSKTVTAPSQSSAQKTSKTAESRKTKSTTSPRARN